MRPNIDTDWTNALAAQGIRTGLLAWLDFASGAIGVWTGGYAITPSGSGDTSLDGVTFEPLVEGVMIEVGKNAFSYSGSEALTVSLGIPTSPENHMVLSGLDAEEYQSRTAIFWRALMITPPSGTTPAVWEFRRVRAGSMDELSISNDGTQHLFTLTIEGHASMISNATGSTWLDQKKFDSADTSQDFAVAMANSRNAPSRSTSGGGGVAPSLQDFQGHTNRF